MSSNIIALPSITRDMLPVWTICIILLNDMSNAFCQPQNLLSTIKVNWSLTNLLSWYASGLHFLVVAICYDTLCKNQKVWINPLDICHILGENMATFEVFISTYKSCLFTKQVEAISISYGKHGVLRIPLFLHQTHYNPNWCMDACSF